MTLGKAESEKYLKELEAFNSKNNTNDEENNNTDPVSLLSQWVAITNNDKDLKLILKK